MPDGRNHDPIANNLEQGEVPGPAERDHKLSQERIAPIACLSTPQSRFRQCVHRTAEDLNSPECSIEVLNGLSPLNHHIGESVQILLGFVCRDNDEPHCPSTCARRTLTFASSLSNTSPTA